MQARQCVVVEAGNSTSSGGGCIKYLLSKLLLHSGVLGEQMHSADDTCGCCISGRQQEGAGSGLVKRRAYGVRDVYLRHLANKAIFR